MLEYALLNEDLILFYFPELRDRVLEQRTCWKYDETLPHCIIGDIFNPYLHDLLYEYQNIEEIKKIFSFYEKLATEGDEKIENLLQTTLLEYLWDDPVTYKRAIRYMGKNTLRINSEISKYIKEP